MNEELSEYYERKLDDAKTNSWGIALGGALGTLILVAIVDSIIRDESARVLFGTIAITAAGICALRFAVLAVMKRRLKLEIARRAMLE